MRNRKIEMDGNGIVECSLKSQVDRMFCGCVKNERGEFCSRVKEIWDEVVEVFGSRSVEELKDEVSDVMFGLGRLLGYVCGKVYVSVWFDERHVRKIENRMEEYGCVRSRRHLVNGMCPCLGE
jgi:NTP pyrophosphatase (non-canonical NTP hydrolase)